MPLLAFLTGLSLGVGFWMWQRLRFNRQLLELLRIFNADTSTLPLMPQLRREIALVQQTQQELGQQLQAAQYLLDLAPIGYLQVDDENQLVWCNQQAREMFSLHKWEPGQVRLLLELVRSYELDQIIEQTRESQKSDVREWTFHPSSIDAARIAKVRSLNLRTSSFPLNAGHVGVFLENLQPLVDLKGARDRAFSDLAHELRTPLTSIRLVVETLLLRVDSPLNRWVSRLLPEIDRLIDLVQSWLELSQLEIDPSKQLHCQKVELRSLINSVWQTLLPLFERQQISLSYTGVEAVWLEVDKSRIYQVFLNLFDNSIKHSPLGSCINVEINIIRKNDISLVEINIIDQGSGFPDTDLPYVFERFYRGDPARSRPCETESKSNTVSYGSGLGLAIVQQIVVAHGGSVTARNHPETGGAWLQVELPNSMADFIDKDYI